jgi:geranylgeranyl diphosphate synthase, type II
MVALQSEAPVQQTRSYVHLMRASSDMFQSPNLERLTGRQRSDRLIDSSSENPLAAVDPIAATESLALDFLSKGGKYSRPFITLATYDAMQGGDCTLSDGATKAASLHDGILRAAMSIEMFHKASLVHDDIEDNDAYRYGQPTMHRRYGLPTAINVGDYMIGLGYRLVSRESKSLGPQVVADILECLSGAHTRLAEGQGAELLWRDGTNKRLSPLDALKIYALKTSPAFEAALYTGVRLAGEATEYVEPIKLFARNIGVAFQILNDLGDWEGDQHNKLSAAGDVLGGRPTILLALALQTLDEESQNRLLEVISSECTLPDAKRISIAGELMRKAKAFDQAHRLVDKHQQKAEEIAQSMQPEALKRLMLYLIETVLERHAPDSTAVVSIAGMPAMPIASRTTP